MHEVLGLDIVLHCEGKREKIILPVALMALIVLPTVLDGT